MSWSDYPPYHELPGKTDPAPTPVDPGWSDWVRKQMEDFRKRNPDAGSNPGTKISLIVESGEIATWATEGEEPGPWEIEPVTRTFSDPHRDLTRYRRKYPSITVTVYRIWEVTLVIEIPPPGGGTFQKTFTFWQPIPSAPDARWVYRWKLTSGERLVHGRPCQWYDGKVPDDWNDHSRPQEDDGLFEKDAEEPPEYLVVPKDDPKPEGPKEWRSASPEMLFAAAASPTVSGQQLFGGAARMPKLAARPKKSAAGRRPGKG
jgi:hypothetical protein